MDVNTDDTDLAAVYAEVDAAIDEAGIAPEKTEDTPESDQEEIEDVQESDEVNEPESDEPAAEPTAEDIAREKGWRPKEEWTGDPDKWISADEFVRNQPLYDRISAQNKELKSVKKTLDSIVKYQKDLKEQARREAIAEIEAKRREAVKYGDSDAFDAAEAELKAVNDAPALEFEEGAEEKTPQAPPPTPEAMNLVTEFAKANPWVDDANPAFDPDRHAVLLRRMEILAGEGKTLDQSLDLALAHVKTVFPTKFTNPNKNKPAAVMSGAREQRPNKQSISALTKEQQEVFRHLKAGGMTEKEFLTDWEKLYGTST